MDIQRFQDRVGKIWNDMEQAVLNNTEEITSIVRHLTTIDLTVRKMATTHIGLLISTAASYLSDDECYVNIGTWNGYSFFAGFLLNPQKTCIGNDNFSLFNKEHSVSSLEKDKANRNFGDIRSFFYKEFNRIKTKNSIFVEGDWRKFLGDFRETTDKKIGLYFYDGDHSFNDQFEALERIVPYLSDNPIIFIDDANLEDVKNANEKFLNIHPDFSILYDIKTPCNRYPTWWNGIQILGKL
jgi:hypothetical protein